MKTNKYKSYLFYSVGEIVLVVLGILIALQINNWNEDRIGALKETEVLIQLQEEYESNLKQLNEKIELRDKIIETSLQALKDIDTPTRIIRDSFIRSIGVLLNYATFDPISNDLVRTGNLRLIRNDTLKSLLANWSSNIIALKEIERGWQKSVEEIIIPYMINSGLQRDAVYYYFQDIELLNNWLLEKSTQEAIPMKRSKNIPSIRAILNNSKLEGLFSSAIVYNQTANMESIALRKKIHETLRILKREIQK